MRILLSLFISACIIFLCSPANASPVVLHLDKQSSRVNFNFSSQMINTSGSFTNYDGILSFDAESIPNSKLEINADASGVTFGSLPMEQMFLLNSLIKSMPTSQVRFESNEFEKKSADTYIVRGIAYSGKHKDPVTLPLTIVKSGTGKHVTGTFVKSGPIGNAKNMLSGMVGNAICRGEFSLLFK